jgi:hypothetical protein
METVLKIAGTLFSKKNLVRYIAAPLLVIGAAAASMGNKEFRDAVCSAPVIEIGE